MYLSISYVLMGDDDAVIAAKDETRYLSDGDCGCETESTETEFPNGPVVIHCERCGNTYLA